jgi:hypothetical protein
VEAVRDLGRDELWQESVERSRARRSQPRQAAVRRTARGSEGRGRRAAEGPAPRTTRRMPRGRRKPVAAAAVFALAVPMIVLPSAFAGRDRGAVGPRPLMVTPGPLQADAVGLPAVAREALTRGSRAATCHPVVKPIGYVDPMLGARLTPERIDQGVDYAGSGTLGAIGAARVTRVATAGTGWPGAFIEYRLLDGADAGCYVYYAEGVSPARGLHVGEAIAGGQPVARLIPGASSGIEIGWGSGDSTESYAMKQHQWSSTSDEDSRPSAAGKGFSALIAALGGQPGKIEG